MSDERLRDLERRWRETGADEDELAWNRERARRGLPLRVTVVGLSVKFEPRPPLGRVARGDSASKRWRRLVQEVARRHYPPWILVDLAGSNTFHEDVPRELMRIMAPLTELGGGIVLCGVPSRVLRALGQLEVLFTPSDSVASCLRDRGWEQSGPAVPIEHLVQV